MITLTSVLLNWLQKHRHTPVLKKEDTTFVDEDASIALSSWRRESHLLNTRLLSSLKNAGIALGAPECEARVELDWNATLVKRGGRVGRFWTRASFAWNTSLLFFCNTPSYWIRECLYHFYHFDMISKSDYFASISFLFSFSGLKLDELERWNCDC